MARIFISESHEDVRRLLERMVARLGHEPVLVRAPTPAQLRSADVLLVEPAAPAGTALTRAAHVANPTLPIICASVTAPPSEPGGVVFSASLVKPFTLEQLADAIERAQSA
jgi:DNA-binding NtrC family response regulator